MPSNEELDRDQSNKDDFSRIETYYTHSFRKLGIFLTVALFIIAFAAGIQHITIDKTEERLKERITDLETNLENKITEKHRSSINEIETTEKDLKERIADLENKITEKQQFSFEKMDTTEKGLKERIADLENKIIEKQQFSFEKMDTTEKGLKERIADLENKIIEKHQSSIKEMKTTEKRIATAEKDVNDLIDNTIDKMNALREELSKQITVDVNSESTRLFQKTEKDLARAMAKTYDRIADVIYNVSEDYPYLQLISVVLYIEGAHEYAKCGEQDELRRILQIVNSRVVIKPPRKAKKSERELFQRLHSIISQNVYYILPMVKEGGYEFALLHSIKDNVEKIYSEFNKKH